MRFHTVFTSALFAALVGFGAGVSCSDDALPGRPRIIATTDGEIDDRCSMVRFLLYANEWDIEGIIHSSSKFHWKGNGKDVKPHNWADEAWLDKQIDLYEKVYPSLSRHDRGFPTADALRKLVYSGNIVNVGDMSKDTPGSDRIVEVLLDDSRVPSISRPGAARTPSPGRCGRSRTSTPTRSRGFRARRSSTSSSTRTRRSASTSSRTGPSFRCWAASGSSPASPTVGQRRFPSCRRASSSGPGC